jgi:hypothetical protein
MLNMNRCFLVSVIYDKLTTGAGCVIKESGQHSDIFRQSDRAEDA